ncbi:hypothetical protein Bca4012_025802 [Brassica carinata]
MASWARIVRSPYGELGTVRLTRHMASLACIVPLAIWRAGYCSSRSPYGELGTVRPACHMAGLTRAKSF